MHVKKYFWIISAGARKKPLTSIIAFALERIDGRIGSRPKSARQLVKMVKALMLPKAMQHLRMPRIPVMIPGLRR